MAKIAIKGGDHWTSKGGNVKLFCLKVRRRSRQKHRHDPVRARLVDGLTTYF
jgi:hypothetical protein